MIPPRPPLKPPPEVVSAEATKPTNQPGANAAPGDLAGEEGSRAAFEGDWEDWFVHRIGKQVVGISRVSAESIVDSNLLGEEDPEVRFERMERFVFRTGSTQFIRRISTSSVETYDGLVKSFQTEAGTGPVSLRVQGTRTKDAMRIELIGLEGKETQTLEWEDRTRGLFALEQSLRRQPMEQGETRQIRAVNPSMKALGLIDLNCPGDVSIAKLDGTFELLREIKLRQIQDEQVVDQLFLWVDDQGVIQKTLRPEMRIESYRVDAATAQQMFGQRDDSSVRVSIKGAMKEGMTARQVAFVIVSSALAADGDEPEGADSESASTPAEGESKPPPEGMVDPAVGQAIRRVEDGLQVLVSSDGESLDGFATFTDQPTLEDREKTELLDFDDPSVERMAIALGNLEKDQLVVELANVVKNVLSMAPQSQVRKASSVLKTGRGGELDHSVLLAAMFRSRGIASRIAFGLRMLPDQTRGEGGNARSVMKLGSWVIAWTGDRWVTVDPLTAKIDQVDRLCLRQPENDLDLAGELAAVFRRIADIDIEIRGVRYE